MNLVVFFKTLPDKGLVEKSKQVKGGKKLKKKFTIAFFVNAVGEIVEEPVVPWTTTSQSTLIL